MLILSLQFSVWNWGSRLKYTKLNIPITKYEMEKSKLCLEDFIALLRLLHWWFWIGLSYRGTQPNSVNDWCSSSIFIKNIKRFQPSVTFHIETKLLILATNQMTGFYIKSNTGFKVLLMFYFLFFFALRFQIVDFIEKTQLRTFFLKDNWKKNTFLIYSGQEYYCRLFRKVF